MAAKITAALLTVLINVAIGLLVFFFMLIAMNGFSGSDAEKGLIAFIVLAVAVTTLMGAGAFLATHFLINKRFTGVVAALIAVPVVSLIGGGFHIACSMIGIAVAEYVRVNY